MENIKFASQDGISAVLLKTYDLSSNTNKNMEPKERKFSGTWIYIVHTENLGTILCVVYQIRASFISERLNECVISIVLF